MTARIAFVTPEIDRSAGGIQNTSYYFAKEFPNHCEFHVFVGKVSEQFADANLKIHSNPNRQSGLRFHFENIKRIIRENRKKKFDFTFAVLHTFGLECLVLKKVAKIPYGIMVHGNELLDETARSPLENFARRIIRKMVLENADVVFANSSYTEQLLNSVVKCKKSAVIHPPVHFENKYKGDSESRQKEHILLSIGRLVERKGFQDVIKAMPMILKEIPEMKYYIAGTGEYKEELKKTIDELNLQEHVFLPGRISEEEKDELYSKCDYFIMPSYIIESKANVEGYGIVFIEANMYGKYVIATRSGGIPDAINEGITGEFVEERNPESIKEHVLGLYKNGSYDPANCVSWAKQVDAGLIVTEYMNNIREILPNAQ